MGGTKEPLASWLRVWAWSSLLPERVLAGWEPVLARVRRLKPAGPADPRTVPASVPVTATILTAEDLAELPESRGPTAGAAALASAPDASDGGYAMVLHRLVAADPAAWTSEVPAVLNALKAPKLGAFSLAAAACQADRPGAFPGEALAGAVTAALGLVRALGRPPAVQPAAAGRADGRLFVDQALFDLLTTAWRTDTALDAGQEQEVLAHLHALAAALARPAPDTPPAPNRLGKAWLLPATRPARALPLRPGAGRIRHCWGRIRGCGHWGACSSTPSTRPAQMLAEVLPGGGDALPTAAVQDAVATSIGVRLPALHRYAPDFTAVHRTALYRIPSHRPSPAASWLRLAGLPVSLSVGGLLVAGELRRSSWDEAPERAADELSGGSGHAVDRRRRLPNALPTTPKAVGKAFVQHRMCRP
ncbi:hypothetical protein [Streptomyces sp. NPDC003877]